MNENNPALPRQYRAVVQEHLDSLNEILPAPDLTQIDVAHGFEGTRIIFRLQDGAEERVTEKFAFLVSHEAPKITLPKKVEPELVKGKKVAAAKVKPEPEPIDDVPGPRAIPVRARLAGAFFAIPFPEEPTLPGEVEAKALSRP